MPTAIKPMPERSEAPKGRDVLRLSLTVVVEKDGAGFYAHVPAFKGVHVDGRTEKEALANAGEAAEVYLHSLVMHGEPLPIGPDCSILREEKILPIPEGAMLRHLELQWPFQNTSGIG